VSGGGPRYEAAEGKPLAQDLLLAPRKERIEQVIAQRTRTLTVVLDKLEDTFNMAAVLRTCEGMGLQEVHVVKNADFPWSPNSKVTQGCDKWLDVHTYADADACAAALKERGFAIQVSAVGEGAKSLFELAFDRPTALVFGNERFGVSKQMLAHADGVFWIPMRGFTQSFNISAAVSASVTHAVAWRLQHGGMAGDLSEPDKAALRERFEFLSVKQRGRVYGRKR